jgi:hypothetical protein
MTVTPNTPPAMPWGNAGQAAAMPQPAMPQPAMPQPNMTDFYNQTNAARQQHYADVAQAKQDRAADALRNASMQAMSPQERIAMMHLQGSQDLERMKEENAQAHWKIGRQDAIDRNAVLDRRTEATERKSDEQNAIANKRADNLMGFQNRQGDQLMAERLGQAISGAEGEMALLDSALKANPGMPKEEKEQNQSYMAYLRQVVNSYRTRIAELGGVKMPSMPMPGALDATKPKTEPPVVKGGQPSARDIPSGSTREKAAAIEAQNIADAANYSQREKSANAAIDAAVKNNAPYINPPSQYTTSDERLQYMNHAVNEVAKAITKANTDISEDDARILARQRIAAAFPYVGNGQLFSIPGTPSR